MSIKTEFDLKVKTEIEESNEFDQRRDPTSFLPEEAMSYEFKKKKKKKKKRQEDPLKDVEKPNYFAEPTLTDLDPEVNIKVENIEVELDFNDFTDNNDFALESVDDRELPPEPAIKIEDQNHKAVLLTFESVINDRTIRSLEQKHKIKTEQSSDSVCNVCHLVFQSQKTLEVHQKRMHKSFRMYFDHICDHCGMAYEMKNSLVAHIKRKHGPDSEKDQEDRTCDICALVFKGQARLRMHKRRKHGTFDETFLHVCKDCGLTYEKYRSLIVHIKRKHSNVPIPAQIQWYRCPFCTKMFNKRETYARHMQRNHRITDEADLQSVEKKLKENSKNEQTGEITCNECPLVFSSVNYLKLHMRRKHNAFREDFRLKCRICNLSYDKMESLKRHVRRKHDERSHCEVCKKQFDTREAYLNHSHIKEIKECSICGLIFASQGGLAKHLRCIHKVDTEKTVFCTICDAGFYDKRQLRPHYMKVHLKVSYTCNYCKKVFRAKESYRRHILFKHPNTNNTTNVKLHQCEQCSEVYKDEFELCKHINMVHNTVAKVEPSGSEDVVKKEEVINTFRCTKCPDEFVSWEPLKLHFEQNHHLVEETQCQICGEMVQRGELARHIKAHHTNVDMKCKYCDFKTKSKVSLTQHLLRHKNAKTIHCDVTGCRYKTFYEVAMEKHKRRHADLGVKFQCSKCPFQSMNKYILRYHEEAHATGKKRYMCDQCDYATILPANLVQHKYKHSTEKRFKCEYCPFATKYNTSLRFHVRNKHCDLPSMK